MIREHLIGPSDELWLGNYKIPEGTFDRAYLEIDPLTRRVKSIFLRRLNSETQYSEPAKLIHTSHKLLSSRFAIEGPARDLVDKPDEYRSLKLTNPVLDRTYHEYDSLRIGYVNNFLDRVSICGSDRCILMTAEEIREKNYTGFYVEVEGVTHIYKEGELICYATNPKRDRVTVWWKNVDGEDCFSTYHLSGRIRMGLTPDDTLGIPNP